MYQSLKAVYYYDPANLVWFLFIGIDTLGKYHGVRGNLVTKTLITSLIYNSEKLATSKWPNKL